MKTALLFIAIPLALCLNTMAQVNINKPINLSNTNPADAKIAGIKDVSSAQDAASAEVIQSGRLVSGAATYDGPTNTYTVTTAPAITVFTTGMVINFKATSANTTTPTVTSLVVSALSAKPIKKNISSDLAAGDIAVGQMVSVMYDGVNFQLSSGAVATGSGNYIQNNNVGGVFATGQAASFDITGNGEINGTLRVNGNVGIGTVTAATKLEVAATGGGGQYISSLRAGGNTAGDVAALQWLSLNGTDKLEMWTDALNGVSRIKSAGTLSFHAGNVGINPTNEFMTILTDGKVGIGTVTPDNTFHVSGGLSCFYPKPGIADYTSAMFSNNADATIRIRHNAGLTSITTDANTQAIGMGTNGSTNKVYISGAGNVGIGTNAPDGLLHAVSTILSYPKPGVTDYASAMFSNNLNANMRFRHNAGHSSITTDANTQTLGFGTNGAVNNVFIAGDGKVGIGSSSPDRNISVRSTGTGFIEMFDFLQPSTSSGNGVYGLIGRSAAGNEAAIIGFQYNSTAGTSFSWLGNYGDSHTAGLIVKKGGNVGVAMTNAPAKLSVLQNTATTDGGLRCYNPTQAAWTAVYTGGDNAAYFQNAAGYVSISSGGSFCSSGGFNACSDIRYKTDLQPLAGALQKLEGLHGYYYYWKKDEFPEKKFTCDKQIGVIAQEVEKVYPEVVVTDDEGYKTVDYSRLTPILLEAIKELHTEVNTLKAENLQFKTDAGRIDAIEKQLADIKTVLLQESKK